MSVRIRYRLEASVSSTSNEEKDLGNVQYETVSDTLGEGGSRKNVLAPGATDVEITTREIASKGFLLVRTNARLATDTPSNIEIKKNGVGGEIIDVVPIGSTREGFLLLTTSGVTALYASNPGTVDMEVTVVAAGD
jgi:hypothetical protein